MTQTQTEIWTLFFVTAILTGLVVAGIGWAIWFIRDRARSWLIVVDEDTGRADVRRVKTLDGEVLLKDKKGGGGKSYFPNQRGRKMTRRGPLNIIEASTGFNLGAPSRQELQDLAAASPTEPTFIAWKMLILDPVHAWNICRTRVAQDFLSANEGKDPWQVRIAPMLLIAVVVLAVPLAIWAFKSAQG